VYNFKTSVSRKNSNAEKYVLKKEVFGTDDIIPVWIADMDIDTPSFILDAVTKRLEYPSFGYDKIPNSVFQAQIDWMKNNHNVKFELKDMIYSHSVVASINVAIEAFTDIGDNVIVQTPVYTPFFKSVLKHKREVLENKLLLNKDGTYSFDIEDLKSKINEKTKLLLLCNPHNPIGKAWSKSELLSILNLCIENNIVVFSDELHCDLVYLPNKHISFSSINKEAKNITITAIGIGKTFNASGFGISSVAIANENLNETYLEVYKNSNFSERYNLSHVAVESAYTQGKSWLYDLKIHLNRNFEMLKEVCDKYNNLIKITPIEATYLAWLDCRDMNLNDDELNEFFIKKAKLGLKKGIDFGEPGSGFMRLNFAVSQDDMNVIVEQLNEALKSI